MRKKTVSIILSAMVLAVFSTVAIATTYSSTLSLSGNSTATGATRSYVGTSHNIDIYLSTRTDSQSNNNYCNVYLYKTSGGGDTQKNASQLNIKYIGSTYSMPTYNQTDGNFYYYFSNRYLDCDTYWTSNNVTMSSN